jgi:hypothetical protein
MPESASGTATQASEQNAGTGGLDSGTGADGEGLDSGEQGAGGDEGGIEVNFGDKKENFTVSRLQALLDAEERARALETEHQKTQRDYQSLQKEFDRQKNELGQLRIVAGKKGKAGGSGDGENILGDILGDAGEGGDNDLDLTDTKAVAKVFKDLNGKISKLSDTIKELTDPEKQEQASERRAFEQEIRNTCLTHDVLKKMRPRTARATADDAVEWAADQNTKAGTEVFKTVKEAVDGYVANQGLTVAPKQERKITQISSRSGGSHVSLPNLNGQDVTGDWIDRYFRASKEERLKVESGLTPAQSKQLGYAMEKRAANTS